MSDWCHNRLEITGKSALISIMEVTPGKNVVFSAVSRVNAERNGTGHASQPGV